MCIRDRVATHAVGDVVVFTVLRDGQDNVVSVTTSASNTDSVSYTHLRAHETVLDIVCRLLLEQKKKTHTYTSTLTITNDNRLNAHQ